MLNKQILDLRNLSNPVDIRVGNDVSIVIYEGDNELTIITSMDNLEKLHDAYRKEVNEPTVEELEEKILRLENNIEDKSNIIERLLEE